MDSAHLGSFFVAIAFVAGCGKVNYSEPSSAPTARVRFVADYGFVSTLRQYDDPDCKAGEREVGRFTNGPSPAYEHKSIGMPLARRVPENAQTEVRVAAEQPFFGIFMGSLSTSQNCRVGFTFVPKADHDYEVVFNQSREGYCSAVLFPIAKNPDGSLVREPISMISMPRGQCETTLKKQYLY